MLEARLARDGRSVALLVRIARAGGKVTRTVFKVCGRSAAFGWVCVSKHRSEARANAAAAKLRRAPVGRQYHEVTVVEERCS
jgi:hypothetical protein